MLTLAKSGSPLDLCPPRISHCLANSIAPSVMVLYNPSLASAKLPAEWKCAQGPPNLKKHSANPDILSNYRLILLLPLLGKAVESHIHKQLATFLDPSQLGFRGLHRTETALVAVTDTIKLSLDAGTSVMLALLDLSVTFNMVCH